ncbi:NADPH-dependent 7-cyano-7-deazaguanine reductase QueF, partial [Halomonas sp. MG34]|nr:NADPH-dependent 7-cyano-7-deazaguanine reductase QueF [Halomonas sp. MG34]
MKEQDLSELTLLGSQGTTYAFDYNPDVLEIFENNHQDRD